MADELIPQAIADAPHGEFNADKANRVQHEVEQVSNVRVGDSRDQRVCRDERRRNGANFDPQ